MHVSSDLLGFYCVWSHRCLQLPKIWPEHLTLNRITYWLGSVSQTEKEKAMDEGCLGIRGMTSLLEQKSDVIYVRGWGNVIKYQRSTRWSHLVVGRQEEASPSQFDHSWSVITWIIDTCVCITLKKIKIKKCRAVIFLLLLHGFTSEMQNQRLLDPAQLTFACTVFKSQTEASLHII